MKRLRNHDPGDGNFGRVQLSLSDSEGELIRDRLTLILTNTRIKGRGLRLEADFRGEPVTLERIPAHPDGFYHLAIHPKKFRRTAVFVSIRPNRTAKVEKTLRRLSEPTDAPDPEDRYMIHGRVLEPDGSPVAGITVRAFAKTLRGETQLGEPDDTDDAGRYTIVYQPPKARLDVFVRASGPEGDVNSAVLVGATPRETLDLVLGDGPVLGPSEVDRFQRLLAPVLAEEGLSETEIIELGEKEVALLAARSGVQPAYLVLLRQSRQLARQTGLPADLLYGMGRRKMPLSLSGLLAQGPNQRREALEEALDRNLIPGRLRRDADRALETLNELAIREALEEPRDPGASTLGAFFAIAGLERPKQEKLLGAYAAHDGAVADFWQKVREDRQFDDFSDAEVDRVQRTLQLGAATHNHAPLVRALGSEQIEEPRQLARLDPADWLRLIRADDVGRPVGLPPDLTAAGFEPEDYADLLFTVVEDAFPSAVVAHRVDRLSEPEPLRRFFVRQQDPAAGLEPLDLRTTPIAVYLRENPSALEGLEEPERVVARLKGLQRAWRIAPRGHRFDTMRRLLDDGLDSAQKVRVMGRAAFLARYEPSFGAERVARIFARANNASAVATILLARHDARFEGAPMPVLAARPAALKSFPDWQTLFGSLDFCACDHCQSVYSPAAYLTDVLHWLHNRPSTEAGRTVLEVLFENRRADIGGIELSCKNTHTPLPYIDLVNEVLERAVAPADAPPAYQTLGAAADLAVQPEHQHTPAYDLLAEAVYPFNLPFNPALEEVRTYLGHLGVPRYRLMAALHPAGREAALTDPALAREALGLSSLEARILTGSVPASEHAAQDFWGMDGAADWIRELGRVSRLLAQGTPPLADRGMDLEELTEALRAGFVQAEGPVEIWFESAACDTERARLEGLGASALDRLHRFLRLKRLSWPARDLDRVIEVLGGGVLDESLLVKLSVVRDLETELRVPVDEMLTWWGSLDTRRWKGRLIPGRPAGVPAEAAGSGLVYQPALAPHPEDADDPSFYDLLFQSPSVRPAPDPAFGVNAAGDALLDESQPIASHLPAVAAALGGTADDLASILPRLTDDRLSLVNLSALYRHVSLARALDLRVNHLVSLLALTGIDPFDAARPEQTLLFLGEARAIGESAFSIEELDYLLRHVESRPAVMSPGDVEIGTLLKELRDALRQAEADQPVHADPAELAPAELRETTAARLAQVVPAADLEAAMAIVEPRTADGEPRPGVRLPTDTEQRDLIDRLFADFLDPAEAGTRLVGGAQITDWRQRLAYVLAPLERHLRRVATGSTVIQKLAGALEVEPALIAEVLESYLHHPDPGGRPALEVMRDRALIDFENRDPGGELLPSAVDLPEQFAVYRRLHKIALMLRRFGVSDEELPWLFVHGPNRGTLDIETLTVEPTPAGAIPYRPWARLRAAFALRDRFTTGRLFDLFEQAATFDPGDAVAAEADLLAELGRRGRWDQDDLEFLAGTGGFGLTYPDDWQDERALERISHAMATTRRIGLSARVLWDLRAVPATAAEQRTQAEAVQQAVRARYDSAGWREIARPLRDRLREGQRDALVGWLIAHDDRFDDAPALFEHFLLDVEMSPCQLTSRVQQASSSCQLFVQRALMNLEPEAALSADDAREWRWMKRYRVWEANRKVFLYPENWLEPELRDDKSPLFEALESELSQGEITAESAERVARGYLEKLDEVARLEIMGHVHHRQAATPRQPATDVLHVFGRTRGTPPRIFYRQRLDGATWMPWEAVDVDVEGDHLLPVIYNRRLHIFWLMINEAAVEETPDTPEQGGDNTGKEPERYYQLRLAWSVRADGKWRGKKLAKVRIGEHLADWQRLSCGLLKTRASHPGDFFLGAREQGGDLLIEPVRYVRPARKKGQASYQRLDRYRLSGCDGTLTLEARSGMPELTVRRPAGTDTVHQSFTRAFASGGLTLPGRNPAGFGLEMHRTLGASPSPFEVVPAHMASFESRSSFFFQDRQRTFFVEPRDLYRPPWVRQTPPWAIPEQVEPDVRDLLPERDLVPIVPRPDPWIYDPGALITDPAPLDFLDRPPLVAPEGASSGGLLESGIAGPAGVLGERVAFVADQPVAARSRRIAVTSSLRIVTVNPGTELISLTSAGVPEDGATLRGLRTDAVYYQPPLDYGGGFELPRLWDWIGKRYRFDAFYHPYLCQLRAELNRAGLDGLWDPSPRGPQPRLRRQQLADDYFASDYAPVAVDPPYPKDELDFSAGGAYSLYNWELFFHLPLLIACRLSKNQRFEEALRWFHYIFDPTESSAEDAPRRFWKVRPFYELFHAEDAGAGPIHELLLLLHDTSSDPARLKARDDLIAGIARWRDDPFKPHAIARLRHVAYQKAVVMKYLDNLIAWGDQLFRRDTLESIQEATQLYVLAAQILGRRPRRVDVKPPTPRTFNQLLELGLDELSNAAVEEVEGYLPEISDRDGHLVRDDLPLVGSSLFFCIPANDKLITDYWDRVADRLFKIRHCMNIEGVVRQLPLFEPPIDPALLVRAAAGGIDIASALADLHAPLPRHRFQVLAQKATELCGDVRGLGSALLAALEKRDAEALALLRAGHEVKVHNAVKAVREHQISEIRETLEGLVKSRENAQIRLDYYRSRRFMSPEEQLHVARLESARAWQSRAQIADQTGSILGALPNFDIGISGFGGSPVVKASWGSPQLIQIARAIGDGFRIKAAADSHDAQMASIMAGHQRRADDWALQADIASKDIEAAEHQILAAEIRLAIAEKELENLELQLANAEETRDFLREKYTNLELYQWMVGQLSELYFQSYQLAYDIARKAERAWQFELAEPETSFLRFGYWDSLKKGLLAGERLHHDLKRMEAAYLEGHRREYELTRHVSLRLLDPVALLRLRSDGECIVRVPEAWFDLDSPGHYLRRLKTVAVSLPSVSGPYTAVRCTLTLLRSEVRANAEIGSGYPRATVEDPRFRDDTVGVQSIVTSRAQEDSGLFETNLRDERYLPFEGAGAISEWRIELPRQFRQFDYDTISDLILHLRYTARDGGTPLREAAESTLVETLEEMVPASQASAPEGAGQGLLHLWSARHDFPDEWYRFLHPAETEADQTLALALGQELLPFALQGHDVEVLVLYLFLPVADVAAYAGGDAVRLRVTPPGGGAGDLLELPSVAGDLDGLPRGARDYATPEGLGEWAVSFPESDNAGVAAGIVHDVAGYRRLNPSAVDDLLIALRYRLR